MIVRRNRNRSALRRMIIRRTRMATVGEHRPAPPRRGPGGVIGIEDEGPRRPLISGRLLAGLVTLALLTGLAAGGVWAVRSPYFRIDTVTVTGTDRLPAYLVIEQSGLLGESMFRANLENAQEAVFGLPLVKAVHVERDWPRGIRIAVEERVAWGTWEQGGVAYAIDREGVVLGTFAAPTNGVVIRSSEAGARQPGDRVSYQAVDAAEEIWQTLPKKLGQNVTEVAFIEGRGVQVTTDSGQVALFGDSSGIAYKLAVWAAIEAKAAERGLAYDTVDLRFGNRPVIY